jgi:murein DD-endopeptidase MepM/ murein hydrolase activator NlpD
MARNFTFFVISDSHVGCGFRQITVSGSLLTFFGMILIICLSALIFSFYSYDRRLNEKMNDNHQLEQQIRHRETDLACQHRQIQSFAEQLNEVKDRLFTLEKLEDKVRTITKLTKTSDDNEQDGFDGIGGSMPEDLNADISLEKKHYSLMREMNEQIVQINAYAIQYEQRLEVLLEQLKQQQNFLACKPSIKPVEGIITSKFGYRSSPFTKRREFHKGMDIANRRGTPIRATADGTVTYAGRRGSFGNMVIIDHGYGIVTRYAHMHTIKIRNGSHLKKGDVIGTIGNTGLSTGPHLHYEVHLNGLPVNPAKYIQK